MASSILPTTVPGVTYATGTQSTAAQNGTTTTKTDTQGVASNFQQFLTLLTTQLKNQNPLDPMDTNQFTQQLVQFAQVEQQLKSNDQLATLVKLQKTTQNSAALDYVGKIGKGAGLGIATAFIATFAILFLLLTIAFVLVALGLPIWAGMLIVFVLLVIGGAVTADASFAGKLIVRGNATGIGMSRAVSAGNAAMVGIADYLDYYADDPETVGIDRGVDYADYLGWHPTAPVGTLAAAAAPNRIFRKSFGNSAARKSSTWPKPASDFVLSPGGNASTGAEPNMARSAGPCAA